jgi:cellulose 1,4-beta-cellobiosidase
MTEKFLTSVSTRCDGNACGGTYSTDRYGGTCDPDGCDFNSYRMGDTSFYGPGLTVNTNSVFTVVTQFLTSTGTASGTMNQIKRFYVQDGVVIPNSESTIAGITGNSITESFCTEQKTVFNNTNTWDEHGGWTSMTAAMNDGMVLVMSLWDDYYADMLWLDSDYPTTANPATPGIARGTCSTSSGVPATIESSESGSYVIYSNIRVGAINSTFSGTTSTGGSGTTSATSATTATTLKTSTTTTSSGSSSTGTAAHWAQCGGEGYTGPTTCASPYTCTYSNPWYSQCL